VFLGTEIQRNEHRSSFPHKNLLLLQSYSHDMESESISSISLNIHQTSDRSCRKLWGLHFISCINLLYGWLLLRNLLKYDLSRIYT